MSKQRGFGTAQQSGQDGRAVSKPFTRPFHGDEQCAHGEHQVEDAAQDVPGAIVFISCDVQVSNLAGIFAFRNLGAKQPGRQGGPHAGERRVEVVVTETSGLPVENTHRQMPDFVVGDGLAERCMNAESQMQQNQQTNHQGESS